jgi:hypothetical protein
LKVLQANSYNLLKK